MKFLEFEACTAAGLDLDKWYNGIYPKNFKADVIAWFELHKLYQSHAQDAVIDPPKKK